MEYRHNPPALDELFKARLPERNARKEVHAALSGTQRFALFMARKIGSFGFFFLLVLWAAAWLVWNLFGPAHLRFDPAPAFVIWIFISNILQLVLLPLILVGQNVEAKATDRRAQLEFEINKKAEHEIEVIIAHLENQNELLLEVIRKIERR